MVDSGDESSNNESEEMVTKRVPFKPVQSNITPPDIFFNRRAFIKAAAAGSAALATQCTMGSKSEPARQVESSEVLKIPFTRGDVFPTKRNDAFQLPTSVPPQTTDRKVAGSHNNFYEFLPGRGGPVYKWVDDFTCDPWTIEVSGECRNPMTLDLDALFKIPHEERLYHFRCVERWAMNVPWSGFPLAALIKKADPKSSAKFVRFESAEVRAEMPGMRRSPHYPWPYNEALRLDEAMNDLTMVVTGVYGQPLPKQHGAPARIIVPWKYGYKSPKSVVKIEFLKEQPKTFWMIQPHEYGFISNVNPNIPHPRWSQATSFWLGSEEPFPTPMFNGYESYVAKLYPDEPRTPQAPLKIGQIAR